MIPKLPNLAGNDPGWWRDLKTWCRAMQEYVRRHAVKGDNQTTIVKNGTVTALPDKHPLQVFRAQPSDGDLIYVRGGAVIVDGVRCVPAAVGGVPGDSLRAAHVVDDTSTVADLSIYANIDLDAEAVTFETAEDGDRSYLLATVTASGRIVQHIVGDIVDGGADGERLHPWKLRVNGDDIEVFSAVCEFHDEQCVVPAGWVDTGIDVPEASSEDVYLVISSGTATVADYQAAYADEAAAPGGRYLLRAYLLGSVTHEGVITQRHRSDIIDDDRALVFGEGLRSLEGQPEYDGSRTVDIEVDDADPIWNTIVGNEVPEHNGLTGKQNKAAGEDEGSDFYHIVPQEWTGSTLENLIDALKAAGVLYDQEEE